MSEKNPSPRQSIDQIDARIVELLDQRATLALEAGQAKAAAGEGAYAPPREAAILSQVDQTPAGAFPRNSLKAVFGEIISACRHLQTQDHIVVLGEKFGWVHDAALAQFGSSAGFDAVEGGDEVVEAIRKDPSILAFLHLGAGSADINLLLEALLAGKFQIVAERPYLPVYSLVCAQRIELPEVTDLFTTRDTLSALRNWVLSLSFPVRINICRSAEEIIENLVDTQPHAGLLPAGVAKTLGHHLIQGGIEPVANHLRRCVTVSGKPTGTPAKGMKTSVLCSFAAGNGALYQVLGVLHEAKCRLLGVQMFPFQGKAWQDLFLIDFEGPAEAKALAGLIDRIAAQAQLFHSLGTYPVLK